MAAKRRKVRDKGDAWVLLEDWDASGLELRHFCKQRGVDGRSLNCWRRNLGASVCEAEPAPLRLMEVVGRQPAGRAEYRLSVGDVVIEVDDDFQDDTLARCPRQR